MPILQFLNPALLWALPLASIPVLIHLLSRRRLPEVRFPTTRFLRDLEPHEIRRLRLRELLLLILRTLAVVLLVLAFARPSVRPPGSVAHAAAAVAVLLDDSESMGAFEETRTRMEIARERAGVLFDAARAGDEFTIVTTTRLQARGVPRSGDRARAHRLLEEIEATFLPARMDLAIEAARRALERSALATRELYVISDFQRANWSAEARAAMGVAREAVRVYAVPVDGSRMANHAIVDVDPLVRPGPEGRGEELRARARHYADAPSDRVAIRVLHDDALIGGGEITLRADESRWVTMPLDRRGVVVSAAGLLPVLVATDEDALAADDRFYATLGAPRRVRVLRVAEPRDGIPPPRFPSLALDPKGDGTAGFQVEEGTPASLVGLSTTRVDVVLLDDVATVSADAEARLRSFVADGGGLVIALGPHADPDFYSRRLFPGLVDLTVDGVERAAQGSAFELRARAPGHAILEGLTVGVGAPLTHARVRSLWRAHAGGSAAVIVQTSAGQPLVVAARGTAVFLSSLSDDWGDLPYSGAFVPLVRGLAGHAGSLGARPPGAASRVGAAPSAPLETAPGTSILVRGPEGYVSPARVESEGTTYRALAEAPALAPGFYRFESGGTVLATLGVNVDPLESDLAPASLDSLADGPRGTASVQTLRGAGALATHLRDTRRGRELWLAALLAAAVLLAAELALASATVVRA